MEAKQMVPYHHYREWAASHSSALKVCTRVAISLPTEPKWIGIVETPELQNNL